MISDDLLLVAQQLADVAGAGRTKTTLLRRSISTSYYAVFHALALLCADELIEDRSTDEWRVVYRMLEHARARDALLSLSREIGDRSIERVAGTFSNLQADRHTADYDPCREFTFEEADSWVVFAREAVGELKHLSPGQRRALAVRLMFKARPNR